MQPGPPSVSSCRGVLDNLCGYVDHLAANGGGIELDGDNFSAHILRSPRKSQIRNQENALKKRFTEWEESNACRCVSMAAA